MGMLYAFHRMSGEADLALQEGLAALREAGHQELAAEIDDVLVGRDVVGDMWTFQIVESYDEQYWRAFQAVDELVRETAVGGVPACLRGRDETARADRRRLLTGSVRSSPPDASTVLAMPDSPIATAPADTARWTPPDGCCRQHRRPCRPHHVGIPDRDERGG